VNVEQEITPDLGTFVRAGVANGNIEPYESTDIDRTAAAGLALNGTHWGRPDDTFGFAGVINGISAQHEAFLNAGGLGILVGDGKLPHPGPEQIIETYYAFPVSFWPSCWTTSSLLIPHTTAIADRYPFWVHGFTRSFEEMSVGFDHRTPASTRLIEMQQLEQASAPMV
jgi:high affinity Mn2+ porin